MHRAGADDDQQAIVRAVQDVLDGRARFMDRGGRCGGDGILGVQVLRGDDLLDGANAKIVCVVMHALYGARWCAP